MTRKREGKGEGEGGKDKRIQLSARMRPLSRENGFRRKLRGFKAISFHALAKLAPLRIAAS